MRARRAGSGALAIAAVLVASGSLRALPDGPPATSLSDLDWLAGSWVLEREGESLDEHWSHPTGNSMVGHFRWTRGGGLWITELMTITEEAGEVVFRLRHFGADMRPWEAADDAFTYRLTERDPGRAVFSAVEQRPGRPLRFVYEALAPDSLLVRIEGEQEGRPTTQEFRYAAERRPARGSP